MHNRDAVLACLLHTRTLSRHLDDGPTMCRIISIKVTCRYTDATVKYAAPATPLGLSRIIDCLRSSFYVSGISALLQCITSYMSPYGSCADRSHMLACCCPHLLQVCICIVHQIRKRLLTPQPPHRTSIILSTRTKHSSPLRSPHLPSAPPQTPPGPWPPLSSPRTPSMSYRPHP